MEASFWIAFAAASTFLLGKSKNSWQIAHLWCWKNRLPWGSDSNEPAVLDDDSPHAELHLQTKERSWATQEWSQDVHSWGCHLSPELRSLCHSSTRVRSSCAFLTTTVFFLMFDWCYRILSHKFYVLLEINRRSSLWYFTMQSPFCDDFTRQTKQTLFETKLKVFLFSSQESQKTPRSHANMQLTIWFDWLLVAPALPTWSDSTLRRSAGCLSVDPPPPQKDNATQKSTILVFFHASFSHPVVDLSELKTFGAHSLSGIATLFRRKIYTASLLSWPTTLNSKPNYKLL